MIPLSRTGTVTYPGQISKSFCLWKCGLSERQTTKIQGKKLDGGVHYPGKPIPVDNNFDVF
jgi:hypothetical protein